MKTKNQESATIQSPTGQDQQPSGAMRRRRSARARSGLLCVLLSGALVVSAAPEWAHEAWTWLRPGSASELPLVPAEILLRAAATAETRGDIKESMRLLRTFTKQHPGHAAVEDAIAQLARHHLASADIKAARAVYHELRSQFPGSSEQRVLLREIAEHELQNEHFEDAMRSYKDLVGLAIRADPHVHQEDTAPSTAATRALQRQQRMQREDERNEIERLARFNLALCQEKTKHPAAAIRAYERFVRRFPTDERVAEAQYRMGAMHLELGHVLQARRQFEPLCAREDIAPVLRAASIYHAGRCSEKLLENDEARRFYRMATALTPPEDEYRLAALVRLARLIESQEPMRAREVYRDLATNSDNSVRRAIARQRFVSLQGEATVAAASAAVELDQ
jgi:TolA-binding protein